MDPPGDHETVITRRLFPDLKMARQRRITAPFN